MDDQAIIAKTENIEEKKSAGWELARARWFIRLFYNREPSSEAELTRLVRLYGGLPTEKFLQFATQQTDFHHQARLLQNIMLDSLTRKRAELLSIIDEASVRPNCFVIGQPRCGTTSLHEYFRSHPDVFVPLIKETNYYSHWSQACMGRHGLNYTDYLMYFVDAKAKAVRCDISPFYISEPGTALRIYRDSPGAKIIAILRNPIDIIISKFNLDHGGRDGEDIDTWIRRGINDYRISAPRWNHAECVNAIFNCMIANQLSEYLRYFAGATKIIIFDDISENQELVYLDLCKFLGIAPVYNRLYWEWKAPSSRRPSEDGARELQKLFLPEIKRIEQIAGRDLSQWYSKWDTA
jgi:hypothetical protein